MLYLKQIGYNCPLGRLNILQCVPKMMVNVVTRKCSTKEYKFEIKPIKIHNLEKSPETEVKMTKEHALMYYTQMARIRRVEQTASSLYADKIIRGFLHLYAGQEAVAVGIKAVMRPDDSVITSYRCHGFALLQGVSIFQLLAELAGRETGECRGKGGSMHLFGPHFYGGNGIVGAHVPVGTGVALALKYRQAKNVIFTCYGDGAANQGQTYEAFNMASLWHLPVVFVCENNKYGMGTSDVRASADPTFYTRGTSMAIPGLWVNGMNILAVREAARFAHAHCISGRGPIIIEASTYRYFGHSMSDPGTSYRAREEITEVRKYRDPITKFTNLIFKHNIATKEELKAIDTKIKHEIDSAVKKTLDSPEAPIPELAYNVYADITNQPLVRFKVPNQVLEQLKTGPAINA